MNELIDEEPALLILMTETSGDVVRSNETTIGLLFDLLNRFLYYQNTSEQEEISVEINDNLSLLCFEGFLLITGEWDKGVHIFQCY